MADKVYMVMREEGIESIPQPSSAWSSLLAALSQISNPRTMWVEEWSLDSPHKQVVHHYAPEPRDGE